MTEQVDLYGMYVAILTQAHADYPEFRYAQIMAHAHGAQQAATSYVWGAEDHGSPVVREAYGREIYSASWEFGYMYGLMDLMYQTERTFSMPSIREAYVAFRNSRDLREYVHEG